MLTLLSRRDNVGVENLAESGAAASSVATATAPRDVVRDIDSADLLGGVRTGLRVPLPLGWAQLGLALSGLIIVITSACLAAAGDRFYWSNVWPLWCSLSMLQCGVLALCYARLPLRKLLAAYRVATALSLLLHSIGLLPLPASSRPTQRLQQLRTAQSLLVAAGWCLLLACSLSDLCVGRNVCQVAHIFCQATCGTGRGRRTASLTEISYSASVDRLDF